MASGLRFARGEALVLAQRLFERLEDACEELLIAGSLRRGLAQVGDIELVAMPKMAVWQVPGQLALFGESQTARTEHHSLLDQCLDELVAEGHLHRERPFTREKGLWGPKQKKLWALLPKQDGQHPIPIDLFIVTPPAQWGPILTIRTGPGEFGKALMIYIERYTRWKQVEGRLVCKHTGIEAQTPTEEDYFTAIRLPVIPPEKRTVERLRELVRGRALYAGSPVALSPRCVEDDAAVRALIRRRLEARAGLPLSA